MEALRPSGTDSSRRAVNNAIYETLGSRWYDADDDPVALLRAESRLRNPWVASRIEAEFGPKTCRVLDIGCGAGFLSNYLATIGHDVTGLDASRESLREASVHNSGNPVQYDQGDALALPYESGSFDVVCAMDFLEHVQDPGRVIEEAARVLTPSGLFFFHTFNRNWLSWLVVIKGVEWFVKNTPPDMHVLHLFLTPEEVKAMCADHGLQELHTMGSRPKFNSRFWSLLRTGSVPKDFEFVHSKSTQLGFTGVAQKRA